MILFKWRTLMLINYSAAVLLFLGAVIAFWNRSYALFLLNVVSMLVLSRLGLFCKNQHLERGD